MTVVKPGILVSGHDLELVPVASLGHVGLAAGGLLTSAAEEEVRIQT